MKRFLVDGLAWGTGLWFFGYVLGFVFYFFVPSAYIGWAIMPFGIAATLWVLFKMIKSENLNHYLVLALVWTVIAVVLDYIFLVKLLHPADGYYKLDVYLYYGLTFVLPLVVGYFRLKKSKA